MTNLKLVELFAGLGGVTFGFDRHGVKTVMAAEWEKFAQKSYSILHPEVELVGDVTKLDAKDVPDCDILSFTTPCQAFSVAGKRLGFDDMRGTLVFEALRIAKEKRPKALFMENVKGLVNHDKGKTLDTIISAFDEIGYTTDFNVLNSKYFGVPQNRERVFIIALRNDLIEAEQWTNVTGSTMLPKAKRRIQELGVRTFNFDWPAQENVTKRLRDVLEAQVDEKYYLSEEKTAKLVAQLEAQEGLPIREATTKGYAVAAEGDAVNIQFPNSKTRRGRVGKQIAQTLEASNINQGVVERTPTIIDVSQYRGGDGEIRTYTEVAPTLTAREYKDPRMVGEIVELGKLKEHRHSSLANSVVSVEGISPTLDTMQGGGREPKIAEPTLEKVGNVNPSGNGMNGAVYSIESGLAPTLTTNKGEGTKMLEEIRPVLMSPKYRIRKLTPLECFRLQGFSDETHQALVDAGISNSQRYKQAGNAVTVNVIDAIASKLLPYLREA